MTAIALPGEILKRCIGCDGQYPLRRFRHVIPKDRCAVDRDACLQPGHFTAKCHRCRTHEIQNPPEGDEWSNKAREAIADHCRGSWRRRGHVPAFAELKARQRTSAQVRFVRERYGTDREVIRKMLVEAADGICPGPCRRPFASLEHGKRAMTLGMKRPSRPPIPDNLYVICDACNAQQGERELETWQDDIFWDRVWTENRARADAVRPVQTQMPFC